MKFPEKDSRWKKTREKAEEPTKRRGVKLSGRGRIISPLRCAAKRMGEGQAVPSEKEGGTFRNSMEIGGGSGIAPLSSAPRKCCPGAVTIGIVERGEEGSTSASFAFSPNRL